MQEKRQRFGVDRQISLQLEDEPHARDIDLVEEITLRASFREDPALFDPVPELVGREIHKAADGIEPHHVVPIPPRGSYGCFGDQLLTKPASSASPSGSTTLRVTYWSPCVPSARGTPLPRRRRTRPVLELGGIVIVTAPLGVGTATR